MLEYYLQIKQVHVAMVLSSGGLFALRGLLGLAGSGLGMSAPVRYLSYTIDTTLLTAALMLLVALKLNPFVIPWLSVKLTLLVLYIALGSFALRRGQGKRARAGFYLAALACFGFMYTVARAHHPFGFLQGLLS